jgi:hypothetical protein
MFSMRMQLFTTPDHFTETCKKKKKKKKKTKKKKKKKKKNATRKMSLGGIKTVKLVVVGDGAVGKVRNI